MSTLPSIVGFHGDLGLSEANAVTRTGSGYRLGTLFEDWVLDHEPYIHSYGEHGRPFGTSSFHLHWIRLARLSGAPPFDGFSPAAALARAGRFVHPQGEPGHPLATFEYGLQLNLPRYHDLIRAFGRHVGVQEREQEIQGVELRGEDGFIAGLRLADGSLLRGDLFIDCTGPAARIRSVLDDEWVDWSRYLPCDRVLLTEGQAQAEPAVMDRVAAVGAGWRWEAPSPSRTSHGLAYASAHFGDSEAEHALRVETGAEPIGSPVTIRRGRRPEPWLRNCVAIGDAAVQLEPLEWPHLHLVQSAVDRVVSMMPGRDCAPVELGEYNRQTAAEADRVRDLIMLHYVTSRRSEPFWREAAAAPLPDSLDHTLRLFRERGRLPFHEEETFARDSWLAVLLGQGVIPRRADPLTEAVPPQQVTAAMTQMLNGLRAMVPPLPTHAAYLGHLMRQAAR